MSVPFYGRQLCSSLPAQRDSFGGSFAKVALSLYLVSIWRYIDSMAVATTKANIEMTSEVAVRSQLERMRSARSETAVDSRTGAVGAQ